MDIEERRSSATSRPDFQATLETVERRCIFADSCRNLQLVKEGR